MDLSDRTLISRLLESCARIAVRAGQDILAAARANLDVRDKADGSPLTLADRASHERIVSGLEALEPRLGILSEEGDVEGFMSNPPEQFWLVDPLDGTKEFIEGYDEYTVNIALVDRGRPVLGVVDAPATGTTWYGGAGIGSMRRVGQSEALGISPSKRTSPGSAVISRSHMSDATRAFLEANNITETEARGSSVKMCAIADGSADIYPRLGPTSIWDTAAGTAVARAAGCRVVDPAGRDLDYDPASGILREGFIVFPKGMQFIVP